MLSLWGLILYGHVLSPLSLSPIAPRDPFLEASLSQSLVLQESSQASLLNYYLLPHRAREYPDVPNSKTHLLLCVSQRLCCLTNDPRAHIHKAMTHLPYPMHL